VGKGKKEEKAEIKKPGATGAMKPVGTGKRFLLSSAGSYRAFSPQN
jgi:hypothetical protein